MFEKYIIASDIMFKSIYQFMNRLKLTGFN